MRFVVAGFLQFQLHFEALALLLRIVQLGVGVADLHPRAEDLKPVDKVRVVAVALGQRRHFHRILVDDRRLDQVPLADALENLHQRLAGRMLPAIGLQPLRDDTVFPRGQPELDFRQI